MTITTTIKQTTTINARVNEHSHFFDSLVEHIPQKFYLATEKSFGDDDDDEEMRMASLGRFGAKKASQKSTAEKKRMVKMKTMEKKRQKLDPNLVLTNAETLQKKMEKKRKKGLEDTEEEGEDEARRANAAKAEESGSGDEEEEEEEEEGANGEKKKESNWGSMFKDMVIDASTPTKEEKSERLEALRKRLEKKIQDSREKRKASEHEKKVKDAKDWREQREKMKLEKKEREKRMKKIVDAKKRETMRNNSNEKKKGDETAANRGEDGYPKMNLAFGNVDVDEVPSSRLNGKKKKETKRDLLSKALQREKDLADAGGDQTKEGKRVAEKHAWEASLKRARGEKVLDDPKLLRKSVKREEKKKQKNKEKWNERTKTVQDEQNAKKKKRKENIKAKADEKIEKNIDRREKKRNRPGFEGRSKGMIN